MAEKKVKPPKNLLGIFEIIPEDMDELDALMENVVKPALAKLDNVAIETYKIQLIAFGAKKIIARLIFKEAVGGTQPLEDALTNLKEVQRAECTMVSLV